MTLLIGVAGKARTGKDTAASYLEQTFGFDRYAFAHPIKAAAAAMGFRREVYDVDGQKERPIPGFGVSYRKILQTLGTEWGRSLHPEFWLLIAQREYYRSRDYGARGFVISDVRFENEATWIRSQGGTVIHLEGPARSELASDGAAHSSESGISRQLGDVVVQNTAGVNYLYAQLSEFLVAELRERGL